MNSTIVARYMQTNTTIITTIITYNTTTVYPYFGPSTYSYSCAFHTDLASTLSQQLRQHALAGVRAALEAALDEELASYHHQLRTAAREAGRSPSACRRCGSYQRGVLTTYGLIPDLRVPKLRSGN